MSFDETQLMEARAELNNFSGYMKDRAEDCNLSTGPPPSLSGEQGMDVDRTKRPQATEETPAQKFAKGQEKGQAPGTTEDPQDTSAPSTLPNTGSETGTSGSKGPKLGRQKGQSSSGGQWWKTEQKPSSSKDKKEEELKEMVRLMGRMLLRVEDSMTIQGLDTNFMVFLRTDEGDNGWSVTQGLYAVAQRWHNQKEENPKQLELPMRNVLLHCFLDALLDKIKKINHDKELLETAQKLGLVVDETFPFLQWDHEKKCHVRATQDPLSYEEALRTVTALSQLTAMPDVIGRFHALRRLSEQHQSEVVPFILQVQNRNAEAQQFYQGMRRLCRCSVMHLVGATLRPTKLGRSPMALQIERTADAWTCNAEAGPVVGS
ncbi:unnamed protein product [Symbiodinium sp. CCMP2592]|nr:unnamed protein product [Symbiodinium sp. CCMP2592]